MTMIEMLKELVENGGMFEHDAPECVVIDFVKLTDEGVVWVSKEYGEVEKIFELDSTILNNHWKPCVKPVDWTKVPIDTKVLCLKEGIWNKRHFAGIENSELCTWNGGYTSWSAPHGCKVSHWDGIKLAE